MQADGSFCRLVMSIRRSWWRCRVHPRASLTQRDSAVRSSPMRVRAVCTAWLTACAVTLVACGATSASSSSPPARAPGATHGAITVGGEQRTYRLYVPASVDQRTAAPLVLVLHGNSSMADDMVQTTQFDIAADTHGFILVYPNGIEQSWNGGFCCEPAPTLGVNDVAFLNALIPHIESQLAVNRQRVYMTGFSSGAIMVYRYACEGSQAVRAIAPVAGTMLLSGCHPQHVPSVLAINGTADGEVPYAGGHLLPGASATDTIVPPAMSIASLWAQLGQCTGSTSVTSSGPVSVTRWTSCRDSTTVELETIAGAGHTWYATGFGPADGAIDATQVIAAFFDRAR